MEKLRFFLQAVQVRRSNALVFPPSFAAACPRVDVSQFINELMNWEKKDAVEEASQGLLYCSKYSKDLWVVVSPLCPRLKLWYLIKMH